ncbi:MAG: hypothetical protein FJY10_11305 [Bacteroidetes bacterium]|nr:hypothetical protein [Bacteroidota bacterium]
MEHTNIPEEAKNNPQENPENPIKNPISTESPKETKTTQGAKRNIEKKKYQKLKVWCKHNLIQTIVAFVTILTLLAYILVSIHQNRLTREALVRADSANYYTRQSLELTKDADSLAKQALKRSTVSDSMNQVFYERDTLSRDRNTKREMRAYIAIESFQVDTITDDFIQYHINLVNTGKTPANNVISWSVIKPDGTGVYNNEILDVENSVSASSSTTHGNGLKFKIIFASPIFIKKDVLVAVKSGVVDLYIFGIIKYYDVFGEQHRTRFCYLCNIGRKSYSTYEKYNDGN